MEYRVIWKAHHLKVWKSWLKSIIYQVVIQTYISLVAERRKLLVCGWRYEQLSSMSIKLPFKNITAEIPFQLSGTLMAAKQVVQMSSDVFQMEHRCFENTSVVEEILWTHWHLKFTLHICSAIFLQHTMCGIPTPTRRFQISTDKILSKTDKYIFWILTH